jgi:hypothetical protein
MWCWHCWIVMVLIVVVLVVGGANSKTRAQLLADARHRFHGATRPSGV